MTIEATATASIFRRLPPEIFSPLASPNRAHYWGLLVHLYESRFGPDAPTTLSEDGVRHREVTADIEAFIANCTTWVDEDGQPLATPPAVRANLALNRLAASGWLKLDRVGVREMVTMPPAVQSFLEVLLRFAEEGPQFLGAKVQSIETLLQEASLDPKGKGPVVHEAARQARDLIAGISSTSVRARDIINEIVAGSSAGEFVASFFEEFISKMYIGDFADLKSSNHPLRNRQRILDYTASLRDDPFLRAAVVEAYQRNFKKASAEDAEAMLEKDLGRLMRFRDMPFLIDRLNESFRRATSQAVSYLAESLRSTGQTERIIEQAIERLSSCELEDDMVATPFAPQPLFTADNLSQPPRKPAPVEVKKLRKPKMTYEQRASNDLRRAMQAAREVTREKVIAYIARALPGRAEATSDDLPINNIHDLLAFCALARSAYLSGIGKRADEQVMKALQVTHGLDLAPVPGEYTDNEYILLPKFTIKVRVKR